MERIKQALRDLYAALTDLAELWVVTDAFDGFDDLDF